MCEGKNRPMMIAFSANNNTALFFRPRCKLWSCPTCARTNTALWALRGRYGTLISISEGHETSFVTLTSHRKLKTLEQTLYVFPRAWKTLRQRVARECGAMPSYFAVPEQHADGRLHMHLIVAANMTERWWKDNAAACGLGFIADEQQIVKKPGQAASYVTKYLVKSLSLAWPRGFRRIRKSQNWPVLPGMERRGDWSFEIVGSGESVEERMAKLEIQGIDVRLMNHVDSWDLIDSINEGVL